MWPSTEMGLSLTVRLPEFSSGGRCRTQSLVAYILFLSFS